MKAVAYQVLTRLYVTTCIRYFTRSLLHSTFLLRNDHLTIHTTMSLSASTTMITYELAKELKDAGFPFRKDCNGPLPEDCIEMSPTLSELIEACGDAFKVLKYYPQKGVVAEHRWRATARGITYEKDEQHPWGKWTTPDVRVLAPSAEEAVARLWLALNKKI